MGSVVGPASNVGSAGGARKRLRRGRKTILFSPPHLSLGEHNPVDIMLDLVVINDPFLDRTAEAENSLKGRKTASGARGFRKTW